jgi:MFS-type transporter involved in bile tolerance (Atg22 family)
MNAKFNIKQIDTEHRNMLFLVAEYIWSGFYAAVFSFGAVYAIRLGASDNEIGYLTAFPALIVAILAIPFGESLQKSHTPNRWIPISLITQRALFLSIVLVPLIIKRTGQIGTAIVILIVITTIPQLLYNLTIFPFYMKVVSEDKRVSFFSATNFISNLVTGLVVALAGIILERHPFPNNYQLVFTLGALISLISLVSFYNVRDPETGTRFITGKKTQHQSIEKSNFLKMINFRSDFGRVVLNQFVQYSGIWAATPVIIIYIINHLHASDAWFGLYNSLMFWGLLAGWIVARIIVKHFGEPQTLKWSSHLPSLHPLLIGLSATLTPILFLNLIFGLVSPVYGLSHNNSLLKAFPPGQEHQAMAVYSTISRIGVFSFSLIGVFALKFTNNIRLVLIACGIISLIGSFFFHLFPVRPKLLSMDSTCTNFADQGAETHA